SNNKWAKLWSTGIGWNLHYEEFLRNSNTINMLRLRASTGFTGSQNYNPNQSLMMFDYIRDDYYFRNNAGAVLMSLGNADLKWQRVRKNNIGADIQMFRKRLNATVDFYVEDSKDALTQVTIPPSLGFTSYTENLGQIRNKGYEVKLNLNIISKPSSRILWSLIGSASHNKNTLLKISNSLTAWNKEQDAINTSKPKIRFMEGQDMKAIWAVQSLGIDPGTGQEIFLTADGKYSNTWNANDQIVAGTSTPDLFGNFGTNFMYKQWQLNLYLLYSLGSQAYNNTLVDRVENASPLFNVDRRALEQRWKQPGDISNFKNIANTTVTKPTTRFVQENDYLRLNSFNLSYEFDKAQLTKTRLQRLKCTFYMNDVFTLSTIKQERGLSYPFARTFTLTIQAGF
ncbi:MAG TPA: TonB-dependent receptor, partial [Parasegetibacter sp.]